MLTSITPRKVALLGSTGSIGSNTLNVLRQHPDLFELVSISCGSSLDAFVKQIEEFNPKTVSVSTESLAVQLEQKLKSRISFSNLPKIYFGIEGHTECISETKPDVVISAMMGTHGLLATLKAAELGVQIIGIANKEILVMAGPFVTKAVDEKKTKLIPVDSEHSAIFQALMGNDLSEVKTIWLTGSGGPFRTRELSSFSKITKAEALKHPNWAMGAKITIDSATMMNKGLEFIEAIRLFDLPSEKVKIIVHPESIVHSMVEYCDGSFMAQLGISDMRIPISLALHYPKRLPLQLGKELNLVEIGALHFENPDFKKFPCLALAIQAEKIGAQGSIVLNAANEMAVDRFLKDSIDFMDIPLLVEEALSDFQSSRVENLGDVMALDEEVKAWATVWKRDLGLGRRNASSRATISL
ncbi:MAG: 1-deoxy-D-xylulose-5-phosphate reductoisomerase [Deltaproteobacteria bacterium]|nr:1-deoxy-D-xylulose-5-phosphate reductoisomerase [Deltaproteobacteria bacterium]